MPYSAILPPLLLRTESFLDRVGGQNFPEWRFLVHCRRPRVSACPRPPYLCQSNLGCTLRDTANSEERLPLDLPFRMNSSRPVDVPGLDVLPPLPNSNYPYRTSPCTQLQANDPNGADAGTEGSDMPAKKRKVSVPPALSLLLAPALSSFPFKHFQH